MCINREWIIIFLCALSTLCRLHNRKCAWIIYAEASRVIGAAERRLSCWLDSVSFFILFFKVAETLQSSSFASSSLKCNFTKLCNAADVVGRPDEISLFSILIGSPLGWRAECVCTCSHKYPMRRLSYWHLIIVKHRFSLLGVARESSVECATIYWWIYAGLGWRLLSTQCTYAQNP